MGIALPEQSNAPARPTPAPIAGWKWGVVWLLFLATMINYMDRQTLGSMAEHIKNEFGLKEEGYGRLEFWFGLSFGLFQFPAGYLADRYNIRWLYAGALLLWSAAGFLTGLADSVFTLMACRVALGVGEAFNWPCAIGIVRRVIPLEARSLANGIFHGGSSIGAVLTPLIVVLMVGPRGEGWRLVFQVVGAIGLVWLVLWLASVRSERAKEISRPPEPEAGDAVAPSSESEILQILLLRRFWIALAVAITVNLTWHYLRIWLPRFFVVDLHFDQTQIQYLLAGYFIVADLGSLTAGWLTRRLACAGWSVAASRKIVMIATASLCLLATPAALLMDPWVTIPLIYLVGAGALGGFANYFALAQDISARHTALCNGFYGTVSWMLIAVLQPRIGSMVDRIGTFAPSLIVMGFLPLVGALIGLFWPEPQAVATNSSNVRTQTVKKPQMCADKRG